jgi:1,4-dihydroxy-6-naphthoate synthase
MNIKIGFSPCPNDTFIFAALINGYIGSGKYIFEPVIADVQELNAMAKDLVLDVTKLSYFAFCKLENNFNLLSSGSALGHGVGPLLVVPNSSLYLEGKQLRPSSRVALPGKETTANFLFDFFQDLPVQKVFLPFNEIEEAVQNQIVEAGVIIHENRFTYFNHGLKKIMDLGEFWEEKTAYPIPLGGIVAKKVLGLSIAHDISVLIKESIQFAMNNPRVVWPYIKQHAQEMDDDVIWSHIKLYVNDYTLDLGEMGKKAIEKMKQVYSSMYRI